MANEFKGAYFQTKQEIMEAYLFLRKNNITVPSETLELMKDAAIKELDCALANAETRESNCNIPLVTTRFQSDRQWAVSMKNGQIYTNTLSWTRKAAIEKFMEGMSENLTWRYFKRKYGIHAKKITANFLNGW